MSLFRDEFVASKKRIGVGPVLIPPQRAALISAIVMLALILLAGVLASATNYTTYDVFNGFVVENASRVAIASPIGGDVEMQELYIHPGDVIVPGEPVMLASVSGEWEAAQAAKSFNAFVYQIKSDAASGKSLLLLASTQAGIVERVLVGGTSRIGYAQPLIVIKGDVADISFQALLPGRVVGGVWPGEELGIIIDSSLPQKQVMARVRRVSRSSVGPIEIAGMYGIPPPREPVFVVDLELDQARYPDVIKHVRPGMGIRVDVPARSMSVLSWLTGIGVRK